jgi:hypothetical protein
MGSFEPIKYSSKVHRLTEVDPLVARVMRRRGFLLAIAIVFGILLAGCGALQGDEPGKGGQSGSGGRSGNVLYRADWSKGLDGWSGVGGWKTLRSQLLNDGSNEYANVWTKAPYQLGDTADYAVEADIQVVSVADPQFDGFGIVVRNSGGASASASASSQAGYKAGIDGQTGYVGGPLEAARITRPGPYGPKPIAKAKFDPGKEWHLYRVEADGNTIRFLIDGAVIAKGVDNTYLSGGQVGLWSKGVQLNVRSFKITKL